MAQWERKAAVEHAKYSGVLKYEKPWNQKLNKGKSGEETSITKILNSNIKLSIK